MASRSRSIVGLASAILGATLLGAPGSAPAAGADEIGDVTVVAVIDDAISPYHWDYLAAKMPQQTDADPANDLPLDQAPHTWLSGFPAPASFANYESIQLTLDASNQFASIAGLNAADGAKWGGVRRSDTGNINYHWFPGTKMIGGLSFGSVGGSRLRGGPASHGTGTSSVAVGNIHGACPECLMVFIQYANAAAAEQAIEWAMSQPWIDVISNSYGFSLVERDRLYSASDVAAQRTASERGQTVFFSAGNGISNTFTVPNSTLFSSQEGPDWIVTVGAVHPTNEGSYSGHGKPADVAGVGGSYPSAYNATWVTGSGQFGGTSNATPTIAGTYARALAMARRDLAGSSRAQAGGVIASGAPYACGAARPACELGDGSLTAVELRARLFEGAVHTAAGISPGGAQPAPAIGEDDFLSEGHGSYFVRMRGSSAWAAEFDRIMGPLEGRTPALARPSGEREWMIVDSYCRQSLWGSWAQGYYVSGSTALPGPSPLAPLRSAIEAVCPSLFPPV